MTVSSGSVSSVTGSRTNNYATFVLRMCERDAHPRDMRPFFNKPQDDFRLSLPVRSSSLEFWS